MRRILVTGANGFVGAYLIPKLRNYGYECVGTVRHVDNNSKNNPADYISIGDIGPDTDWDEALSGIDTVVHLAARVHLLSDAAPNPLDDYRKVNVHGTEHLAEQSIRHGVRRFVYASSIKVNGEATVSRQFREDDSPAPVDPYGISKLEAEQRLREMTNNSDMDVVIIRPPLVYGPGVGGNFMRLLELVERRLPLPFASVDNARSMVSLENLTDFLMICLEHPNASGQTFMVSDGMDWSTPELIRAIGRAMGFKTPLFPFPVALFGVLGRVTGQRDAVNRLCQSLQVDISKSHRLLDWRPHQAPEDAIQQTVDWYLSHRHA